MPLVHCIYCSSSTDANLSKEDLQEILEQSRKNNQSLDVTGILLFEGGAFFQVIEGEEGVVSSVYRKIEKDKRHQKVTKLIMEEISERAFGLWSMGYPQVSRKELKEIPGLNDFFSQGNSFLELEEGRAKLLIESFKNGKWHV